MYVYCKIVFTLYAVHVYYMLVMDGDGSILVNLIYVIFFISEHHITDVVLDQLRFQCMMECFILPSKSLSGDILQSQ